MESATLSITWRSLPCARKVTVLHEGSVLAEGLLSEVQANEKVVEVYLGR